MSSKLLLPSFFVLGAQKSATTSIHNWLKQHKEVSLPIQKETHYFSKEDPNKVIKYPNIISLYDINNNYYLGQHIIIDTEIICHGKGLLQYNNGDLYIGNFFNHNKHGYGIRIVKNTEYNKINIFEGFWKENKFIKGVIFSND